MAEPTTGTNSIFWGQVFGIFLGSFFTLLGIWFTNFLSEKNGKKEKKREVFENFSYLISKACSLAGLAMHEEDNASYFSQCTIVPALKHEVLTNKEEYQRHKNIVLEARKEMVHLGGEIHKLYATYKFYFGLDENLKNLINEFVKPLDYQPESYAGITDLDQLKRINASNQSKVSAVIKEQLVSKRKALADYLDKKILRVK